ncbi:Crp/Fnr family transcriptional regulator [Eubacteriales bacterium KG127]
MENFSTKELAILGNTVPFKCFATDEILDAVVFLNGNVREFDTKSYIFRMGEKISSFGIVLEGQVFIENTDFLGNQMILGENQEGDFFAETYASLENIPLLVDVRAGTDCKILFIDMRKIKTGEALYKSWYHTFMRNMLIATSMKNINLSNRSFHTRPKSARGRISSYLSGQRLLNESDNFCIPFNRQEMADYLNLDRSALSKELGRMKKDGLISFKKNHFRLREKLLNEDIF